MKVPHSKFVDLIKDLLKNRDAREHFFQVSVSIAPRLCSCLKLLFYKGADRRTLLFMHDDNVPATVTPPCVLSECVSPH